MTNKYYLAVFNEKSWQEFLAHGGSVYGTRKKKLKPASRIHKNDYLVCYISKCSEIRGLLKVLSDPYIDETPLWNENIFPLRFNVKIIEKLPNGSGIPILELRNELLVFKSLNNPKFWGGFFINSFNEFSQKDGERIVMEINKRTVH
jgi:hypothetical protein